MDNDSAIQEDVQTPDNDTATKTTEREPSARELAMDAIAASRAQEFEKETGIKIEAVDPDTDPDAASAEAARAQLAAQQSTDGPPAEPLPSQKVRVKIDGVESEVTVEEMQREYQKGRTADKRLAEAAEQRRLLQEEQLAAQTRAAPAAGIEIDPAATKEFTAAMFEGDEDAAGNAFKKAVSSAVQTEIAKAGRSNATLFDAATIAQQVKQQLNIESALDRSKQDYPQMYDDPDIEALGATKIQRMTTGGMSFESALESVGTELAQKFGWHAPGRPAEATKTTTRDAKLERKAGIDNVTGANVKSSNSEPAPLTNSQVIAEIAKSRGQAV